MHLCMMKDERTEWEREWQTVVNIAHAQPVFHHNTTRIMHA